MTDKLTLAAVAVITILALVGAVVLTALGFQVPELLPFVVTTGVGILGGSAMPRMRSGSVGDGSGGSTPANGPAVPTALTRTDTGALLHPRKAA